MLVCGLLLVQILVAAYDLRWHHKTEREQARAQAEQALLLTQVIFDGGQSSNQSQFLPRWQELVGRLDALDVIALQSSDGGIDFHAANAEPASVPAWFRNFIADPSQEIGYQATLASGAELTLNLRIGGNSFYLAAWQGLAGQLLLLGSTALLLIGLVLVPSRRTLGAAADQQPGVLAEARQSQQHESGQTGSAANSQDCGTLFETLPIGIFVYQLNSQQFAINNELRHILRLSGTSVSVRDLESRIHPEDVEPLRGYFSRATIEGKKVITGYYRYYLADGSMVWAKLRLTPTLDSDGNAISLVGGVLDVTAERERLHRIQTLSTMFETLSRVNYLVVTAESESALLSDIPEALAQVPGFDQVCFYPSQSSCPGNNQCWSFGSIQVAAAEFSAQLVGEAGVSESPLEFNSGVTLVNCAAGDERLSQASKRFCRDHNIHSVVVLPLSKSGETFGSIVILSQEDDIFNDNVLELVIEVSEVTSFALTKFANEEQKRQAELELTRNEERLRLGLSVTKTGMFEVNFNTNKVILDDVSRHLYGIDSSDREYSSDEFYQLLPDQLKEMVTRAMLRLATEQDEVDTFSIDERLQCLQSGCRWLRIYGAVTAERTDQGEPIRVLGFISDITDQKEQEDREYLAATVFAKSNECILILDQDSRIIMANQAFSDTYGYEVDEVMGETLTLFRSDQHGDQFYREIQHSISTVGSWQGEWWRKYKNGEEHPALAVISAVRDSTGVITHQVIQEMDISDQKEAEQRISNLAYHDSLTNLPNRTLLRDRVEQAIAAASRDEQTLALLFLDLDHFKNINDSLGHDVGDLLLQEVAHRLQRSIRKSDTVGRLGGDEFMTLLPESQAEDAALVAEKILEECSKPYLLNNHNLAVTPSIGIAMYPRDGDNYDELLKKADTAMYRAKDCGRNGFRFFTPEMNEAVFQRMILESRLREALDKEQFELVYQPKYCIEGKQLVGVEALLRWNQPEMGMVSPAEFIPVAEDSGLIIDIGHWVLAEVCGQIKSWQDQGLPLIRVSINCSSRQFAARNVEKTIFAALSAAGIPGHCLEVEITESLLAQDTDYTLQTLNTLKKYGIDISVDDFGTGYSSLSYLKRFPIDRLKIDKSFVRDISRDADDRAIASAVITMGHSLGIQVIAEGVETQEQMDILKQMQCDELQGFYLGRPMNAEEMTRALGKYLNSKVGRLFAS